MKDAKQITDELNAIFAAQNELERQKDEARAKKAAREAQASDKAWEEVLRLEEIWLEASSRLRNLVSRVHAGQNPRGELYAIGELRKHFADAGSRLEILERLAQARMAP